MAVGAGQDPGGSPPWILGPSTPGVAQTPGGPAGGPGDHDILGPVGLRGEGRDLEVRNILHQKFLSRSLV